MADRVKKSVTPSGCPFSVRALKGKDQELISKINPDGSGDTSGFNKMLAGALLTLGKWSGSGEITPKKVGNFLSNDRKFMLVVMRQHTLNYQKEFQFNYEWPLEKGGKEKEVQEYSVNFTHKNFPVEPYYWVKEAIEKEKKDNPNYEHPDGHIIPFPAVEPDYLSMIEKYTVVEGEFKLSKQKFKWELLDGNKERKYAGVPMSDLHINTPLIQRNPKVYWAEVGDTQTGGKKPAWINFDTSEADVLDLEQYRKDIKNKEGNIDTLLTIQHQTNSLRQVRVDLVTIPAFFFPSQAL